MTTQSPDERGGCMSSVSFTVPGVPAPQGSKVRTKWGVREDNPATRPWRTAVAWEACTAMGAERPLDGPLELRVVFRFPRPKSHYGTGKNAGVLKASAPWWHTARPDTDKLIRAIGDALTGVVVTDDSQFSMVVAYKVYGTPCAEIKVQSEAIQEIASIGSLLNFAPLDVEIDAA